MDETDSTNVTPESEGFGLDDIAGQRADGNLDGRHGFVLSAAEWAAFEDRLDQPLTHVEELRELLSESRDVDLSDL